MAPSTKGYELLADEFHETTSKPGDPFTFKTHKKGDTVQLDAEQAERLLAADAVAEKGSKRSPAKAGGQTKAPKGSAPGVGTGDAEKGAVGDGGPDPAGTGSTAATGVTGGAADGQGSGDDTASSDSGGDTGDTGSSGSSSTPAKTAAAKKSASSGS